MTDRLSSVADEINIRYRLVDELAAVADLDRTVSVPLSQLRGSLEDAVHTEAIAHLLKHVHVQITNLPEILDRVREAYVGAAVSAIPEGNFSSGACAISRHKTKPIPHQTIQATLGLPLNTKVIIPSDSTLLFLDDDTTRHAEFSRLTKKCTVTHVYTAAEACHALDTKIFDCVFLDHDLAIEDIMCDPRGPTEAPTGLVVAKHIAAMPTAAQPHVVVVHSMNRPAARAMEGVLKDAHVNTSLISFDLLMSAIETV